MKHPEGQSYRPSESILGKPVLIVSGRLSRGRKGSIKQAHCFCLTWVGKLPSPGRAGGRIKSQGLANTPFLGKSLCLASDGWNKVFHTRYGTHPALIVLRFNLCLELFIWSFFLLLWIWTAVVRQEGERKKVAHGGTESGLLPHLLCLLNSAGKSHIWR